MIVLNLVGKSKYVINDAEGKKEEDIDHIQAHHRLRKVLRVGVGVDDIEKDRKKIKRSKSIERYLHHHRKVHRLRPIHLRINLKGKSRIKNNVGMGKRERSNHTTMDDLRMITI
eukprot:GHVR01186477.1.p1 GENE.GHVR01186477.1~~GHVR01186477.1.p1  ORF type:complete len:114 (-),score=1.71 GHVR01186477.1:208-549(-)